MDWSMLATLVGMVAAIVGGVWVIENRFEKRLEKVEQRLRKDMAENHKLLKSEIEENRQLIIKYIAQK